MFTVAAIPIRGCKEPSWHRNERKERQWARGLIAASKIGIAIPKHYLEQAHSILAHHHATDPHMMQTWLEQQFRDFMAATGKGDHAADGGKAKGNGKGKGKQGTKGASKGGQAGKGWGDAGKTCFRCGSLNHAPR